MDGSMTRGCERGRSALAGTIRAAVAMLLESILKEYMENVEERGCDCWYRGLVLDLNRGRWRTGQEEKRNTHEVGARTMIRDVPPTNK